jgi:bacterial/archaeal transporter family-2 protein
MEDGMPSQQSLYVAIALLAGVAVPVLASVNASFGQAIGNVWWASLMLCIVAFATILGVSLAAGSGLPGASMLAGASWWHLTAGCFFTVYIVSMTFVAPRIGLGNAIILVVVAQIVTAVAIDHFGLLGATVTSLDWKRALGVAFLVTGVVLARSQPGVVTAPG